VPASTGRVPTDRDPAVSAAAALLTALGVPLDDEHRRQTPARLAGALREMLTPPRFDLTTFDNVEGYDEFVVVEAVPFVSLCEHHVLPSSAPPPSATCRTAGSSG
jgi:GTP cyclohydrolase I